MALNLKEFCQFPSPDRSADTHTFETPTRNLSSWSVSATLWRLSEWLPEEEMTTHSSTLCLGNPTDRGARRATLTWGHEELDTTEHAHIHSNILLLSSPFFSKDRWQVLGEH